MYYNNDYGIKIREVNLSGEAYFDVVKNAEKPFIIHAGKINIKVLGTAFNVNCYPEEKNTVTSLLRGSLEVTMKDRQESIILKPNEKLIVSNDENRSVNTGQRQPGKIIPVVQGNIFELSRLSVLSKDNSIVETSWLNNKLVFRSESFEDLAIKMERWYGVGIRFKEEKLKAKRFTGIFEKESIAQALAALQLTTPFTYKINRDSIFINK
jgi:ferric-dicitrate binding protein FerR (iron transport regulator)